jgi:(p)ppGpp synthase/HD superfamily hydrolase
MVRDLITAFKIAEEVHRGKTDKAEKPYIQHPLRVASKFDNSLLAVVALLHDTVEDAQNPQEIFNTIQHHFTGPVVDAVNALTRKKHEPVEMYLQRVKANQLALKVKLADINDNENKERMELLTADKREALHQKYRKYRRILETSGA